MNSYNDLEYTIRANSQNFDVVNAGGNLRKMTTETDAVTYWIENNGVIEIISQLDVSPAGLYVNLTCKRPGSTIFASDFYEMILKDSGRLIISGELLSNGGLNIWKQLLRHGKKILAYDTNNPLARQAINSEAELLKLMGDDISYKRYRFILSESTRDHASAEYSFELLRIYNLTFGFKTRYKTED